MTKKNVGTPAVDHLLLHWPRYQQLRITVITTLQKNQFEYGWLWLISKKFRKLWTRFKVLHGTGFTKSCAFVDCLAPQSSPQGGGNALNSCLATAIKQTKERRRTRWSRTEQNVNPGKRRCLCPMFLAILSEIQSQRQQPRKHLEFFRKLLMRMKYSVCIKCLGTLK